MIILFREFAVDFKQDGIIDRAVLELGIGFSVLAVKL